MTRNEKTTQNITTQNNADIWVYNSYNKIGQNNKAKKTIAYYITLIPLISTL